MKKTKEIEKEVGKSMKREEGKIIRLKLKDIKPYPNNAKQHTEAQIGKIRDSIVSFGYKDLIAVDENNIIIEGHGRLMALYQIDTTGTKEIQVFQIRDLDENQKKAYRIAHNKVGMDTGFDEEILKEEFHELEETDSFNDTGFDTNEITEIWDKDKEAAEDNFEEPKEAKYKIELGEIWELGNHRLMCGDSTNKETVDKLMNGTKADMVFTDPPYGYSYKSNRPQQKKHEVLENDDKILDFFPMALSSIKENSPMYVFCGWQTVKSWLELHEYNSLKIKNIIIWKKNNHSMGDLKGAYAGQYEMLIYSHNGRVEIQGERDRDIWEFDRVPPKEHPTTKPIELCAKAIQNHTGESVLDLFGGSGSTLIACEQLNRKCYMMELDPFYISIIIERWENLTNKQAIKLDGE